MSARDDDEGELLLPLVSEPEQGHSPFHLALFAHCCLHAGWCCHFFSLERPAELLAHQLWETRLKDFSQEHNITFEELKSLLHHYEEARTAGIRTEKGRALWDIPAAFYFVGTVVSTIGKSRRC